MSPNFASFFSFFPPSLNSFSSQERVIENLRQQKDREDRTRLEELEQMRKENQELKNKLSALQPPNASQNQVANPGVTQNQRPDREVGTHEFVSQNGCCVDERRNQYSQNSQNKIRIAAEEGAPCAANQSRLSGVCFDGRNISLRSKS